MKNAAQIGTIVLVDPNQGTEQSIPVLVGSKIYETIETTEEWPDVILTPGDANNGVKFNTYVHKRFRDVPANELPVAEYVMGTLTFIVTK